MRQHLHWIKFIYETTLGQQWSLFDVVSPQKCRKLPVVLSQDEVHQILGQLEFMKYRTVLCTIHACGLRLKFRWIDLRRQEILPVPYFHLVFTVAAPLRPMMRSRLTTTWV